MLMMTANLPLSFREINVMDRWAKWDNVVHLQAIEHP
jgi:hypothetical protein